MGRLRVGDQWVPYMLIVALGQGTTGYYGVAYMLILTLDGITGITGPFRCRVEPWTGDYGNKGGSLNAVFNFGRETTGDYEILYMLI